MQQTRIMLTVLGR